VHTLSDSCIDVPPIFFNLAAIGDVKIDNGVGYVNRDKLGGQSACHAVRVPQAIVLGGAFRRETSVTRILFEYRLAVAPSSTGISVICRGRHMFPTQPTNQYVS
jgi:hypothetical protein